MFLRIIIFQIFFFTFFAISNAQIYISEVDFRPLSGGNRGEWFELYNSSENPINISGWNISENEAGKNYTFPENTFINGKSFFVVTNFSDTFQTNNSGLAPDLQMATTSSILQLNDAGDKLTLVDKNQNQIDEIVWTQNVSAAGKTLCRKFSEDIWINNCSPTPKAENFPNDKFKNTEISEPEIPLNIEINLDNNSFEEKNEIPFEIGNFEILENDEILDEEITIYISCENDLDNEFFFISGNKLSTNTSANFLEKNIYNICVSITKNGEKFEQNFEIFVTEKIVEEEVEEENNENLEENDWENGNSDESSDGNNNENGENENSENSGNGDGEENNDNEENTDSENEDNLNEQNGETGNNSNIQTNQTFVKGITIEYGNNQDLSKNVGESLKLASTENFENDQNSNYNYSNLLVKIPNSENNNSVIIAKNTIISEEIKLENPEEKIEIIHNLEASENKNSCEIKEKLLNFNGDFKSKFSDFENIKNKNLFLSFENAGIISGDKNINFNPEKEITLEEFLKIFLLSNCHNYRNYYGNSWEEKVLNYSKDYKIFTSEKENSMISMRNNLFMFSEKDLKISREKALENIYKNLIH